MNHMVIKILFQESKSASHAELMEFDFAVVHPMIEGALRNAEVVGGLLGVEPFLLDFFWGHAFTILKIMGAIMRLTFQIHNPY
jgi:hypothetical protein